MLNFAFRLSKLPAIAFHSGWQAVKGLRKNLVNFLKEFTGTYCDLVVHFSVSYKEKNGKIISFLTFT